MLEMNDIELVFGMLITIITSAVTAIVAGIITFYIQEHKLKAELKTEYMAENAVKLLLSDENWKKRSFTEIKKRIGGFRDDELRKILVRAGAVRFEAVDGSELWGLMDKNKEDI